MNQGAEKAARENFGSQLVVLANGVLNLAQQTRERQEERLCRITRPGKEPTLDKATAVEESWPPFLQELRGLLGSVKANLESMNDTLDRLEI